MEIILRAEKIMDIINGKKQKPATTEVEEVKTWNDGNEKGMLIISTGLEYSQLQTVIACETAAQMWNRLKNVHEQRSSVNKVSLKQQFFSYRMNPNDNIAQHISTIESMALSLADVGEAVSDVDKIAKTLESLPINIVLTILECPGGDWLRGRPRPPTVVSLHHNGVGGVLSEPLCGGRGNEKKRGVGLLLVAHIVAQQVAVPLVPHGRLPSHKQLG
uniref:Uncharacterized protein n=1 Tax=Timema tahoe TaxID=61484 RepID=A0A7R9NXQ2_9NEOP|nr:unnamed protein product [Timema tahoe]